MKRNFGVTDEYAYLKLMQQELPKKMENAYCPYSNFKVACGIVTKSGDIFYGVNYENAAYGSTICAERNAFAPAIASGHKPGDFLAIYCITDTKKISGSCGACLQVMAEFMDNECKCFYLNKDGEYKVWSLKELLPNSFTIKDLSDDEPIEEKGIPYTKNRH